MYADFAWNLYSKITLWEVTMSSQMVIESFSNYRSTVIQQQHSTLGLLPQHDDSPAYLGGLCRTLVTVTPI